MSRRDDAILVQSGDAVLTGPDLPLGLASGTVEPLESVGSVTDTAARGGRSLKPLPLRASDLLTTKRVPQYVGPNRRAQAMSQRAQGVVPAEPTPPPVHAECLDIAEVWPLCVCSRFFNFKVVVQYDSYYCQCALAAQHSTLAFVRCPLCSPRMLLSPWSP